MIRRLVPLILLVVAGCATVRPPEQPKNPKPGDQFSGMASWYGQEYAGRTTANGEIFDPMLLTAAHRTLPFGTVLQVQNPRNGKTVEVRINDRGPFIGERVIDLSYGAAQQLDLIDPGVAQVDMTIVKLGAGDREPPVPYVVSVPGANVPAAEPAPPAVPFPIPSDKPANAPAAGTAPSSSDDVFGVDVVEEHAGQETRKEVAADGTTVRPVPVRPAAPLPPPPAAPAPQKHSAAASAAQSGFLIQLGAFQSEQNAQALRQRVSELVPHAYVEPAGALYRVRVGPFGTRTAAIEAREKLEAGGFSGMVIPIE